ncbi:MAG TPA: S1/P1 nuclease [Pseudolabrys sp.]|nr:S1/P1 nuclease [Pseudolabrys sp.]
MRRLTVALIFLIGMPGLGFAWGELGHRTVAEIASRYLSERATAEVRDLLGEGAHAMAEVSVWADAIREEDRPETYDWHVVEIPPDGVRYDRVRDCKSDNCIVEKIKEFTRTVGNRNLARLARIEALMFLIHFVGDLHMPLHAYAPFNHPAGAWVRIGETTDKIHLWWDNEFVDELGFDSSELANKLAAEITVDERKEWEGGTSEEWANESFQITREFLAAYTLLGARWDKTSEEKPIVLPVSVLNEVKPIVTQQLKMAGVRLAWLLNQALK